MAYRPLTQKEYSNLKARLTRAERRAQKAAKAYKTCPYSALKQEGLAFVEAQAHVLRVCREAHEEFSKSIFPDYWHRWQIAYDDAKEALIHSDLRDASREVWMPKNPFYC